MSDILNIILYKCNSEKTKERNMASLLAILSINNNRFCKDELGSILNLKMVSESLQDPLGRPLSGH
jgi:hypothetical protein